MCAETSASTAGTKAHMQSTHTQTCAFSLQLASTRTGTRTYTHVTRASSNFEIDGNVQVFLAYPGTMGANYIDYNVVDKIVVPDQFRQFYTERMLYMPHCYQANSFKDLYSNLFDDSKVPARADHSLPAEPAFVFCNFCQLGRITLELFHTWMNILRRVPLSSLWLLR